MMTKTNQTLQIEQPRIRTARFGEFYGYIDPQCVPPIGPCHAEPGFSSLPLVAEHEARVIAGVNLTLAEDHTALIHDLWIEPAWHESDLSLRMIVAALEHGRKLGCLNVDMDPGMRLLAVFAMLLNRGVLKDRSHGDSDDQAIGVTRCDPRLYKNVAGVLA